MGFHPLLLSMHFTTTLCLTNFERSMSFQCFARLLLCSIVHSSFVIQLVCDDDDAAAIL